MAADNLLLSLGVGPSEGVDSAWQMAAFLDTWTKGGGWWGGAEKGSGGGWVGRLPEARTGRLPGAQPSMLPLPPLPPPHQSPTLLPPAGQNGVSFSPKGLAIAPLGGWGNNRHA